MTTELRINEKFMEKLVTTRNPHLFEGIQYLFRFDNNFGASVVKSRYTYGGDKDLWEMALIYYTHSDYFLMYINDFEEDVIGYLTDEEVNKLLEKIEKY